MPSSNTRSSADEKRAGQESFDLEALNPTGQDVASHHAMSRLFFRRLWGLSMVQKLICYPTPGSLKIRPTSWLDGVRGVAALGVYLFHTMGCWASLVSAWHADENQNSILQLPILRTLFVSGPAAVSVFFVLSGYVLTHKSLRWMRQGATDQLYPAVASSMFRRGFRLYLPPILLTFCEMLATRVGVMPALNFSFVPESTLFAQFRDWLVETNHLVNPIYNLKNALQGFITHAKYDAVIWTIPLEFYGSIVCYTLLFILSRGPTNNMRMALVAVFACSCMALGSWNIFCFSAGMLLADFNLSQEEQEIVPSPRHRLIWTGVFATTFYLAGFPTLVYAEAKLQPMPGFELVRLLTPISLIMEDHSRFWWSISGVLMLLSISQLPRLKGVFESSFCQYLGKISFSLYLLHEFCLVLFGLNIQGMLMHIAGLESRGNGLLYWIVCGIWYVLFSVPVFALAAQVERWVDTPSVNFAKWLEGRCLAVYRNLR
jgi:peptidoglycan/LPS O-acetylase OafA/YrhL